jgi:three-Cys-motif partner protein
MDAVWGDSTWRTVVYRSCPDLLGEKEKKVPNREIAHAFRDRLKRVAGFEFVPDPIPMRNTRGATVYYLYFASPNKNGAKIVGDIFNSYRTRGVS